MPNNFFIAVGDSITAGDVAGTTPYTNFLTFANGTFDVSNIGLDSETLATMGTNAPANVAPLARRDVQNICVVFGGTNDIAIGGQTAAATYTLLQNFCATVRAAGFKVIVVTAVSRTGGWDTTLAAYNALITAGYAGFADGLADVGGNANLAPNGSNFSNTSFFLADAIHPKASSDQNIIAPIINAAINAITTSALVPQVKTTFGGAIGTATSVTANPIAIAAGDLVVAVVRWQPDVAQTVASIGDGGDVFVPLTQVNEGVQIAMQFFYCKNASLGTAKTITANFSATAAANSIFVWAIKGADPVSPLDQQTSGTSVLALVTSSAFTTTRPNSIILASAGAFQTGETYTAKPGYILDAAQCPPGVGNSFTGAQHLIVSQIQSNITSSMTASASAGQLIAVATFALLVSLFGETSIQQPVGHLQQLAKI